MILKPITPFQLLQLDGSQNVYITTKVTGDLTLDEIRKADGVVVEIDDNAPYPVQFDTPEEPARRKSSVDHDRIMELAAAGYPPKEIAEQIGCSEQTVRNHIARENPR